MLVLGYLAGQVESKLSTFDARGLRLRSVYNPFYEISNNLMSLWLARDELDGDLMITNGDNLFSPDVFRGLASCGDGIHLAINRKSNFDFDDMKITLDGAVIRRVSKEISDSEAHGESPGLALVRGRRAQKLAREQLELLGRRKSSLTQFWLELFNALYEQGIPVHPWWFDATGRWTEVDFHRDVESLRALLTAKSRGLKDTADEEAA